MHYDITRELCRQWCVHFYKSWSGKAQSLEHQKPLSLNRDKRNSMFEVMRRNFRKNEMLTDFINNNIVRKKGWSEAA